MATEVITSLVQKLYEVAQTVQGNKESCKEINERAQRLIPALTRIASSPAKKDVSQRYFPKNYYFLRLLPLSFLDYAPFSPGAIPSALAAIAAFCRTFG